MSIDNLGLPDYTGQIYALGQRVSSVELRFAFIESAQATYNARLNAAAASGGGGSAMPAWSSITGKPTTLAGYGITDSVSTFAQLSGKPTTLAGYGITDAQSATGAVAWSRITTTPTTRAGYGITDAGDMLKTDNLSGLTNLATARTNLGLGTLSTQSGTFSGSSSGINTGDQTITLTGDVTGSGTGSFGTLLSATGVTAGSYTNANLTVDAKGRITSVSNGAGGTGGGSGTVTSVSVASANGVSGTVANPTTTPAITLALGAITPSSVAATGAVSGSNLSGTNTGDQTSVTGNAGSATKLQTARTINGVAFDGTTNITLPTGAAITDIRFPVNFTGAADAYIPAYAAMTIAQGNAPIGTGTVAYAASTSAAPSTFNTVTLPATLQAGAWLKVSVTAVTGFYALDLYRSA